MGQAALEYSIDAPGGRGVADVIVRRSKRARYASVSITAAGEVEVVLPRRVPSRCVPEILREKSDWIRRQLGRFELLEGRRRALGLDEPGMVWLHGDAVPVRVVDTVRSGWTARLRNGELVVRGPHAARPDAGASAALLRWYRREAKNRLTGIVSDEADRLGVRAGAVTIRDPRTRWASCSARGSLSFSWRLLLAPYRVLDYVVVHELCHLRELNHSLAFWKHVEAARPDYRREVAWLRDYGHALHAYRPKLRSEQPEPAAEATQLELPLGA